MTNRSPRVSLSLAEFQELAAEYGGLCLACCERAWGVEPDARDYICEACGENAVYGAEELLFHGQLEFLDDKESRDA